MKLDALRDGVGRMIGRLSAPAISRIARLRRARMFHPDGHTFTGTSDPVADPNGPYASLARALQGQVLARCSAALWKSDAFEHLDVLGLALRFRANRNAPFDAEPHLFDTDLLTATIRSPLTMLLSPLFTDASDFAGNRYWAVSPFSFDGHRFELRLTPLDPPRERSGSRTERLARAVAAGRAAWLLEARETLHLAWQPVARIALRAPIAIDQQALRFDPFRGALQPVGLVHAIRRAAYAASQHARAAVSGQGRQQVVDLPLGQAARRGDTPIQDRVR
jgi:hypothetical protein